MRKWPRDQIDLWCEQWARERKKVLGINLKERLEPHDRLGKLNCTLGQVLEDKVGAGETSTRVNGNGHVNQNWPEVYTGIALDIHRGFVVMRYEWRKVMDAHYVFTGYPNKEKQRLAGMSATDYWASLAHLKVYLAGYLHIEPAHRPKRISPAA
jgi:hypothetical protein